MTQNATGQELVTPRRELARALRNRLEATESGESVFETQGIESGAHFTSYTKLFTPREGESVFEVPAASSSADVSWAADQKGPRSSITGRSRLFDVSRFATVSEDTAKSENDARDNVGEELNGGRHSTIHRGALHKIFELEGSEASTSAPTQSSVISKISFPVTMSSEHLDISLISGRSKLLDVCSPVVEKPKSNATDDVHDLSYEESENGNHTFYHQQALQSSHQHAAFSFAPARSGIVPKIQMPDPKGGERLGASIKSGNDDDEWRQEIETSRQCAQDLQDELEQAVKQTVLEKESQDKAVAYITWAVRQLLDKLSEVEQENKIRSEKAQHLAQEVQDLKNENQCLKVDLKRMYQALDEKRPDKQTNERTDDDTHMRMRLEEQVFARQILEGEMANVRSENGRLQKSISLLASKDKHDLEHLSTAMSAQIVSLEHELAQHSRQAEAQMTRFFSRLHKPLSRSRHICGKLDSLSDTSNQRALPPVYDPTSVSGFRALDNVVAVITYISNVLEVLSANVLKA